MINLLINTKTCFHEIIVTIDSRGFSPLVVSVFCKRKYLMTLCQFPPNFGNFPSVWNHSLATSDLLCNKDFFFQKSKFAELITSVSCKKKYLLVLGYFVGYLDSCCKDRLHVAISENHCFPQTWLLWRKYCKSKCQKGRKKTPPQKLIANLLRFLERMLFVDKLYQGHLQYFSQEGRAQYCYMPTKIKDG